MGNSSSSAVSLTEALKSGNGDFVQTVMQQCSGLPERVKLLTATTGLFAGKKTMLHVAAKAGQAGVMSSVLGPLMDAVTAEIEEGVYPGTATELLGRIVNQQDGRGRSPLLSACVHGHWDCAELLLEAGSNVFACDKDGNGVLHLACIHGHQHVVQQLLSKADAQAITGRLASTLNLSGFTPLHYAAWAGAADIVRWLLASGVDQRQGNWGEYDRWLIVPLGSTAMHVAAVNCHSSACLAMLEHHALLVREWTPGGGPPLPVDPRTRVDCQGNTPLQSAVWKGSIAPDCQLAMALNPRVDIRSMFHADSLQAVAELRQRGPKPLRVIAAESAKHHLLQQLAALEKQQQLLQHQQHLQQQRHCDMPVQLQGRSKICLGSSHHAMFAIGAAFSSAGTSKMDFLPRFRPGSMNGAIANCSSSSNAPVKPPLHPDSRRSSNTSGAGAAAAGTQQSLHAFSPCSASPEQLCSRNTASGLLSVSAPLQDQQQQQHQVGMGFLGVSTGAGIASHCEIEPACHDDDNDLAAAKAQAATQEAAAAAQVDAAEVASLLVQLHAPHAMLGRHSNIGVSSCNSSNSSNSSNSGSAANLVATPVQGTCDSPIGGRVCNTSQSPGVSEIDADVSSRGLRGLGFVSISGMSRVSHTSGSLWPGSADSIRSRRSSLELPPAAVAASTSAVFAANKQHVAKILQEADAADPSMLSYKSLTSHRRTGSLSFATSLAGALPGCVSDKLVHCLDHVQAGSFVSTHIGMLGSAASSTTGGGAAGHALSFGRSVSFRAGSCGSVRGEVCAVCMDKQPGIALAGCGHVLCLECARCIVQEGVGCRAPLCPFCRMNITGFGLAAH